MNNDLKIPFLISCGIHILILFTLPFVIIYKSLQTYKITEIELVGTSLKPEYFEKVKYEETKPKSIEEQPYWTEKEVIMVDKILIQKVMPRFEEEEIKIIEKEEKRKDYVKKEIPAFIKSSIEEKKGIPEIKKLSGTMNISGPIAETNRAILSSYYPTYPKNIQVEVRIELKFWVLPDGTVSRVIPIKRGEGTLENLAIAAMKKWLFEPLPKYAKQEIQWGVISLVFKLK